MVSAEVDDVMRAQKVSPVKTLCTAYSPDTGCAELCGSKPQSYLMLAVTVLAALIVEMRNSLNEFAGKLVIRSEIPGIIRTSCASGENTEGTGRSRLILLRAQG